MMAELNLARRHGKCQESEIRVADFVKNRIRNRYTIEFLGTWEMFTIDFRPMLHVV